jgi:cytochrome c-type biogenesis protein
VVSAGALSLAILAGSLAAFNPCGFALLPAYLISLLVDKEVQQSKTDLYKRAIKFSMAMTLGFIFVFGSFATVISPFTGSIARYLPFLTEFIGIALLVIGFTLIRGRSFNLAKFRTPNIAPTGKWRTQIGYGITFALASLSCTIGPFLAITATAVQSKSIFKIIVLFTTYALGMGIVVLVLAFITAAARNNAIIRIRNSQGLIAKIGGVFLVIVGIYEVWYGWFEIRVLSGENSSDAFINFASKIQSAITGWVANLGTGKILLIGSLVALALTSRFAILKLRALRQD